MKAISLWQPWASALFIRLPDGSRIKGIETRSWSTNYTGKLVIHAAKAFPKEAQEFALSEFFMRRIPHPDDLPRGVLLGTVKLMGTRRTEDIRHQIDALEKMYGNYESGRFAWFTTDPVLFPEPIPFKGKQLFFEVPDDLIHEKI
jgi:hypothetical protein